MPSPRLLLLSNSYQYGFDYMQHAKLYIRDFFSKYDVTKILFLPYAAHADNYATYTEKVKTACKTFGLDIEGINEKPDPIEAVKEANGIYIGGGNSFRLLKTLYEKKLIEAIRKRVLDDQIPYMGSSAGTNVATRSICTTNDMPICYPPSFDAMNFVPFNINPHYIDPDEHSTHRGETRITRIKEYHEIVDIPVLGLKEGGIVLVENNKAILQGIAGAKLFKKKQTPILYEPGDDLTFLLNV